MRDRPSTTMRSSSSSPSCFVVVVAAVLIVIIVPSFLFWLPAWASSFFDYDRYMGCSADSSTPVSATNHTPPNGNTNTNASRNKICLSGGTFGKTFDNSIRTVLFWYTQRQVDYEFEQQQLQHVQQRRGRPPQCRDLCIRPGAAVVQEEANRVGVPVLTGRWFRRVVSERSRRYRPRERRREEEELLGEGRRAEEEGDGTAAPSSPLSPPSPTSLLVQPTVGDWYRPLEWWRSSSRPSNETAASAAAATNRNGVVSNYYEAKRNNRRLLLFDEVDMDRFMYEHYYTDTDDDDDILSLWDVYQEGLRTQQQRVELWAICAVYEYGGIFVAPHVRSYRSVQQLLFEQPQQQYDHPNSDANHNTRENNEGTNNNGGLWFRYADRDRPQQPKPNHLEVVASTRSQDPRLHCMIAWIRKQYSESDASSEAEEEGEETGDDEEENPASRRKNSGSSSSDDDDDWWDRTMTQVNLRIRAKESQNDTSVDSWCHDTGTRGVALDGTDGTNPTDRDRNAADDGGDDENSSQQPQPRWKVRILEVPGTPAPQGTAKTRWSQHFLDLGCTPSWWCHRCLRMPWFGTFARCRGLCGCYADRICSLPSENARDRTFGGGGPVSNNNNNNNNNQPLHQVAIHVDIEERQNSTEKRIPRMIHQTWFESLSTYEYPHLQRLQHSWKASTSSGWEYRFYTDRDARNYVQERFPKRFLDAYDAIAVPAFRADFFRLCVLAVDGGVYADIDVQLDVHLDAFVTHNLSFFVPQDVNIDYWRSDGTDSNYCMWNGLIGASPGHPIVVRALQDVLNRALNRDDYFDVESELCRRSIHTPIWKLRCSPMLLMTGPCALGMSMSDALGRPDPLSGWDYGWQSTRRLGKRDHHDHHRRHESSLLPPPPAEYDWGDVLVLLSDRYDMKEMRFTDTGRNLLVASTSQDRISTRPLSEQLVVQRAPRSSQPSALHYSNFESDVVGEKVYTDDRSYREKVQLDVHHRYI